MRYAIGCDLADDWPAALLGAGFDPARPAVWLVEGLLARAAGRGAGDAELIGVLTLAEGVRRRIDQVTVGAWADLQRRGTFAERGYRNPAAALGDLLGWERAEARRHLVVAEQATPRTGLDGAPLPPRLPATAAAFGAGAASLRHVEVVTRVLPGWEVRIVNGRAEFAPPPWIDPLRRPRRRPPPVPDAA